MQESGWISRIKVRVADMVGQDTELETVLRGGGFVFGLQILRAGISFAALAGLARMIGVEQYGIFAFYFSLITLLSLLGGLGFPLATVRFVASYRESDDWPRMQGYLRIAVLTVSISASGLALAVGGVAMLTGMGYGGAPATLYWPAFAAVPLLSLVLVQAQIARTFLWPVLFEGPARILTPFVLVVSVFVLWRLGLAPDAQDAVGATFFGALAACLILFVVLRRRLRKQLCARPPVYETRLWLATAVPMLASSGAGLILNEIDVLLAGVFLPPSEVAVYQAAARVAMLSAMIIYAQNAFVGPRIAALYQSGKRARVEMLLRKSVRLTLVLTLVFVLGLVLTGPFVLSIFGPEFRDGYPALLVLLASVLTTTVTGPLGLVLNMTGHARTAAFIMAGAVALNVLLHILLVPRFGIIGSASSVLLANIAIRIFLLMVVKSRTGLALNIFARGP
jgi:O-antigen/teichoic acid export membrane protein